MSCLLWHLRGGGVQVFKRDSVPWLYLPGNFVRWENICAGTAVTFRYYCLGFAVCCYNHERAAAPSISLSCTLPEKTNLHHWCSIRPKHIVIAIYQSIESLTNLYTSVYICCAPDISALNWSIDNILPCWTEMGKIYCHAELKYRLYIAMLNWNGENILPCWTEV